MAIICMFLCMRYNEVHGHLPLMKPKKGADDVVQVESLGSGSLSGEKLDDVEKSAGAVRAASVTEVSE